MSEPMTTSKTASEQASACNCGHPNYHIHAPELFGHRYDCPAYGAGARLDKEAMTTNQTPEQALDAAVERVMQPVKAQSTDVAIG